MNHKWGNKEKEGGLITQRCETCGCGRTPTYNNDNGWIIGYIYERNSMVFRDRPDCIDWEVENAKTID